MPQQKSRSTIQAPEPGGYIPSLVSWNITFRCNLRCAHCYLDARPEKRDDELSTDEGESLIDALQQAGTRTLILSGGEPLLREDLIDLVHYGTRRGLHMALGTNGTLVSEDMALSLKRAGIRKAAISLDSTNEELHDRFRGKTGAWGKAIQGMKACQDAGIAVQIHTTVTPSNYSGIESILSFGENMGIRDYQLFFLVPSGRGVWVCDIVPVRYEEMIREVLRYTAERDISVRPTCAPQFIRIADQMGVPVPETMRGCVGGLSYCRIYPSGEVTPCPYLPLRVGSVREKSFQEIWDTAPELIELRDVRNLKGRCGGCSYAERCRGCRARAFGISIIRRDICGGLMKPGEMNGDYLAEDPSCHYLPEAV